MPPHEMIVAFPQNIPFEGLKAWENMLSVGSDNYDEAVSKEAKTATCWTTSQLGTACPQEHEVDGHSCGGKWTKKALQTSTTKGIKIRIHRFPFPTVKATGARFLLFYTFVLFVECQTDDTRPQPPTLATVPAEKTFHEYRNINLQDTQGFE
ncbi:hypothetical protein L218DRAFT_947140 [Marasmius fiardii PR-910]|nr:hypothetical protein L218DRAFT_947140 [Marasmius fiardii PR-910]